MFIDFVEVDILVFVVVGFVVVGECVGVVDWFVVGEGFVWVVDDGGDLYCVEVEVVDVCCVVEYVFEIIV